MALLKKLISGSRKGWNITFLIIWLVLLFHILHNHAEMNWLRYLDFMSDHKQERGIGLITDLIMIPVIILMRKWVMKHLVKQPTGSG